MGFSIYKIWKVIMKYGVVILLILKYCNKKYLFSYFLDKIDKKKKKNHYIMKQKIKRK